MNQNKKQSMKRARNESQGLFDELIEKSLQATSFFVDTTSHTLGRRLTDALLSRGRKPVLCAPTPLAAIVHGGCHPRQLLDKTYKTEDILILTCFHLFTAAIVDELDLFLRAEHADMLFGGLTLAFIGRPSRNSVFGQKFLTAASNHCYGWIEDSSTAPGIPHVISESHSIIPTLITSPNEADYENMLRLKELPDHKCFSMFVENECPLSHDATPLFADGVFAMGSQVVLAADIAQFAKAGSRGIVIDFAEHQQPRVVPNNLCHHTAPIAYTNILHPVIRLYNKQVLEVPYVRFSRGAECFWAIPLFSAWALPPFPIPIDCAIIKSEKHAGAAKTTEGLHTTKLVSSAWPIDILTMREAFLKKERRLKACAEALSKSEFESMFE